VLRPGPADQTREESTAVELRVFSVDGIQGALPFTSRTATLRLARGP